MLPPQSFAAAAIFTNLPRLQHLDVSDLAFGTEMVPQALLIRVLGYILNAQPRGGRRRLPIHVATVFSALSKASFSLPENLIMLQQQQGR